MTRVRANPEEIKAKDFASAADLNAKAGAE
jgi:hypothetical protein